jgi:DNA-binding MurR/RpiR family transcriptional regulator
MSAASFDELKEAIAGAYPALPKQLQRIARFALDKPDQLALGTVAAVAGAAGVQPSAMIRFANALDYAGFTQMQQVFREHLLERSTSYRDRIEQLRKSGPPRGEGRVLHQFVGDAVAELGQLDDNIRQADLHAAVLLLCRAERLHLLAQRRAFPIAAYLTYALGQLELRTHLLDGVGGMLDNALRSIAPRDVLVVTSFHSYSPEVVSAAAAAHERGIGVLAITDSATSPLKPAARVCFELGGASEPAFRSLVAPLCLAQALVLGVGHRLAEVAARPKAKAKGARRNGAAS